MNILAPFSFEKDFNNTFVPGVTEKNVTGRRETVRNLIFRSSQLS